MDVVPVTAVITALQWGPEDQAEVHFLNDRVNRIQIEQIAEFIAESQNPENTKGVRVVYARFPELAPYQGLCFIDTPGLESALIHNTEASLDGLPTWISPSLLSEWIRHSQNNILRSFASCSHIRRRSPSF